MCALNFPFLYSQLVRQFVKPLWQSQHLAEECRTHSEFLKFDFFQKFSLKTKCLLNLYM